MSFVKLNRQDLPVTVVYFGFFTSVTLLSVLMWKIKIFYCFPIIAIFVRGSAHLSKLLNVMIVLKYLQMSFYYTSQTFAIYLPEIFATWSNFNFSQKSSIFHMSTGHMVKDELLP